MFNPYQVNHITLNYVYFDNIPIVKKWIRDNKRNYHLVDMEPKDKIRINPITTILEQRAEHLYEAGFKSGIPYISYLSKFICPILNLGKASVGTKVLCHQNEN